MGFMVMVLRMLLLFTSGAAALDPEIMTSLLFTYASSEYLHGSRQRCALGTLAAVAAQLPSLVWSVRLPAVAGTVKLPVVAACFVSALYLDTVARHRIWTRRDFVAEVYDALMLLLPVFPVLSLLIAFVFLEVGEVFESVGLPTSWLNDPIYYGVLYGPFAYVYVRVKARANLSMLLPTQERMR